MHAIRWSDNDRHFGPFLFSWDKRYKHCAVMLIPLNHAHEQNLVRAHTEGDDKYVKRWLNDGDNRAWRSFEGHV